MANERILCTGTIVHGQIEWHISPLLIQDEQGQDKKPQTTIDVDAELQELIDSMDDETFWRQGAW